MNTGDDVTPASLFDLLANWGGISQISRFAALRALRAPWCRPEPGTLPQSLRDDLKDSNTEPPVGWVLLVSVEPLRLGSASLLAYGHGDLPGVERGSYEPVLGPEAHEASERARRAAVRGLPLLPPSRSVSLDSKSHPLRLFAEGRERTAHDGPSFGLAMLLGEASNLLDLPVPSDVCALASVGDDDSIGKVGGLERKLAIVCRSALGVRRVLVATEQAEQARVTMTELDWSGEIVPTPDLVAAFSAVFPDLEARIAALANDEDLDTRAEQALHMALESSPRLLGWRGVAGYSERLLERLPEERTEARRALDFAARIARRHQGMSAPITWPDEAWLESLHRRIRAMVLAHVVQSAADADPGQDREYVERAENRLPAPGEEDDGELRLLGAIGRCRAALGDTESAIEALERAVSGWFSSNRGAESSLALSELLRVVGLARDRAALAAIEARWLQRFVEEVDADPVSLGHVLFEAGRAWTLCGDASRALRHLDDGATHWESTRAHLQATRLRWLSRARVVLGLGEEGERSRAVIESRAGRDDGGDYCIYAKLVSLDRTLEQALNPLPVIESLLSDEYEAHEFRRLDDPQLSPEERGRRLADGYRY